VSSAVAAEPWFAVITEHFSKTAGDAPAMLALTSGLPDDS